MEFTERDVPTRHSELAAVRARGHKLIRVKELATSHKVEQMCHLRLPETVSGWKRYYDYNMS